MNGRSDRSRPSSRKQEPCTSWRRWCSQNRWAISQSTSQLIMTIITGRLPEPLNLGFHLFLAAASVSALLIRWRRYQEFVGIASAGAFVAYVALLFTRLG